jgi:glycosyltransferase involved in cell wall biosynthesis
VDISVIVPVYNVEKYLVRCLDSIFNQQFSGTFEVIAVDDASTDSSLQVLQAYQKNEDRLMVIAHDSNKKLSIARSSGMKVSKGDYIMHVDADDWLLPSTFESLHSKCKKTGADVVVFGIIQEDNAGNTWPGIIIKEELITTDKLMVQEYFFGSTVNKIVKRKLTENMISGTIGVNSSEDLLYSFEILLKASIIYSLPENFYVYFVNTESLTKTVQPEEYIQNQVIILNQIQLIVDKYKPGSQLTENVLNHNEKWLYPMIAQIQFGHQINRHKYLKIISRFRNIPIMSQARVNKLESAMTNKYRCLIEVAKRLGIRTAIGISYRGFRK